MDLICKPRDICTLNETKEYLLIASSILDALFANKHLPSQAPCLWQLIYDLAKFNANLRTKISTDYLAKKLSKSKRTIHRYLNALVDEGYLRTHHNYKSDGSLDVNTYEITIPKSTHLKAQSSKDRCKPKPSLDISEVIQFDYSVNQNIQSTTKHNESINSTVDEEAVNHVSTRGSDKNVTYNTNDFNIYNNSDSEGEDTNVVNTINELNIEIENVQRNIDQTERTISEKRSSPQNKTKISEWREYAKKAIYNPSVLENIAENNVVYEFIHKLESKKHAYQMKLDKLKATVRSLENKSKILLDPIYINKIPGKRTFNENSINYLSNKLSDINIHESKRAKLMNEIIYESRFGSLALNNQTKSPNPILRSINIALKLVRDGRWSKPFNMEDNL